MDRCGCLLLFVSDSCAHIMRFVYVCCCLVCEIDNERMRLDNSRIRAVYNDIAATSRSMCFKRMASSRYDEGKSLDIYIPPFTRKP